MKEIFRCIGTSKYVTFIYYADGTVESGLHREYQLQWRYHNGKIEWKGENHRGWIIDTDSVQLAYQAYIASLILESKE